jgi:hypothetical protein
MATPPGLAIALYPVAQQASSDSPAALLPVQGADQENLKRPLLLQLRKLLLGDLKQFKIEFLMCVVAV